MEENAGGIAAARELVKMDHEQCTNSEDVYLEAARSHGSEIR